MRFAMHRRLQSLVQRIISTVLLLLVFHVGKVAFVLSITETCCHCMPRQTEFACFQFGCVHASSEKPFAMLLSKQQVRRATRATNFSFFGKPAIHSILTQPTKAHLSSG
ncbi:hypothetical protein BJ741DRAFT_593052 [Chytriomyces cf. hyalinus JEL632]|nr:hypothetical protein BJ741DRAFT_593052 [Chytriomyces cf. hyalinus JEL632]